VKRCFSLANHRIWINKKERVSPFLITAEKCSD